MPRSLLDEAHVHSAIRAFVTGWNAATVQEVQQAVRTHDVVVVGMGVNPFVKKARKALEAAGVAFHYLGYGSYTSAWKERSALKMWTGWPTFPMVFVRGTLVGGANDLQRLLDSGELKKLLAA
jgi:monothiol glutaredoxin